MNDTIMDINSTLYPLTVSTASVSITLAGNDKPDRSLESRGFNVNITNLGSNPVFCQAGTGAAAPTVTYPVSGTATNGKLIAAGACVTWRLPYGTRFISSIAGAGSNFVAFCVDEGV